MSLHPRNVAPLLEAALADTPVVTLQGARQTGKSTLAEQVAVGRDAVLHTMDDDEVRSAALADPATFVASAGDRLLVIDEVQRAPELILPIKAAVDRDRRPGRFLLTGSADLLRVPGAQDSLAGRAETIPLSPLSQGELVDRHEDIISTLLRCSDVAELAGWQTELTRADVVGLLCAGGLPEAVRRTDRRRSAWLNDYVDRLLRRDARDLTRVPPQRLRATLDLLAANQSGELVAAHLARAAGSSVATVTTHLDKLEALYLVSRIPAWSRSLVNRRVKKAKYLVTDSALCAALNRVTEQELLTPLGLNHLGPALEGFVAAELLRQSTWSATSYHISHYRESGGAEVDIVVTGPAGRTVAIEVKATQSVTEKHFSSLRRFRTRLGEDFAAGIVLNLGQQAWSFGDRMLALPVSALWEPLD